jgi:Putative restriction endonuclease
MSRRRCSELGTYFVRVIGAETARPRLLSWRVGPEKEDAVVGPDFRDAHVTKNCYAPNVFRMVVEVTSSNWADDLGPKAECYAQAGLAAYLVADRKHDEVLLYTDPVDGKYPDPLRYKRGHTVPVPESVGVALDLSVDTLLDGDG